MKNYHKGTKYTMNINLFKKIRINFSFFYLCELCVLCGENSFFCYKYGGINEKILIAYIIVNNTSNCQS